MCFLYEDKTVFDQIQVDNFVYSYLKYGYLLGWNINSWDCRHIICNTPGGQSFQLTHEVKGGNPEFQSDPTGPKKWLLRKWVSKNVKAILVFPIIKAFSTFLL
jgi:hypothetical protein